MRAHVDHSPTAPLPTPGDVYVAAALADHLAHCVDCRERAEAAEVRATEYGESIRRRDRLTLGLRDARRAVTA